MGSRYIPAAPLTGGKRHTIDHIIAYDYLVTFLHIFVGIFQGRRHLKLLRNRTEYQAPGI